MTVRAGGIVGQSSPGVDFEATTARPSRRRFLISAATGVLALAALTLRRGFVAPAAAQEPALGPSLRKIGEIGSAGGRLQAVLGTSNIARRLPGKSESIVLRHFWGRDVLTGAMWPPADDREAMNPGPTLRARVGDFVEIKFFNAIDVSAFGDDGIDRGETGKADGCEVTKSFGGDTIYPLSSDVFPNCFHGSSTTNIHFHGFHVSPDGLGDNVLLKLRPNPQLKEDEVGGYFDAIFERTRRGDPPRNWRDLPLDLTALQEEMLAAYDDSATWKGEPGTLPTANRLLPLVKEQVAAGMWPQFEIGAHPFSFQITPFVQPAMAMTHHKGATTQPPAVAGQAPGTHWYHTHVHGSTAINMYHGMAGVFVVEGESYDDKLRVLLPGLVEQVMIVQQYAEFPPTMVESGKIPSLMVNGQATPTISMRPGEVQLWRLVNGSVDAVCKITDFRPRDETTSAPLPAWKQTAQDGVQFDPKTYATRPLQDTFYPLRNFAPGNRVDLLVQAPALAVDGQSAIFDLEIAVDNQSIQPLLTLVVSGEPMAMTLPTEASFPPRPSFLADLPDDEPPIVRTIKFSETSKGPLIDGREFSDGGYDHTMVLGDSEEWKLVNTTNTAAHPFHIHVNPFQVIEVFDPGMPEEHRLYIPPTPRPWQDTVAIPRKKNGVTAPGYVKIRHRFDDFTGSFVLHCHILEHEDRGMMQLVRVIPKASLTRHH
ncbi:multicopper oxidase domain-containing protein [Mesorhizobium sp. M0848]|uniref:multicopper oxidase domain-containing protein n=1 Tax=Mesorhizobium sp. M0848 TaxID=2957012 RepID=UPI0033366A8D